MKKEEEEKLKSDCKSAAAIGEISFAQRRKATAGATAMKYSIGSRRSRRQGRIARNAGRSSGIFRCLSRTLYLLTFPDLFPEPGGRWKTAVLQNSTVCSFLVRERTDFLYNLPWNRGLVIDVSVMRNEHCDDEWWPFSNRKFYKNFLWKI